MTARNRRHDVIEVWREGTAYYDVSRPSWEDPDSWVVLQSFLARAEAVRYVEGIERRQDELVIAVDGVPTGAPLRMAV